MANTEYKIYVACLASYNAGDLVGEWIEVESWDDSDSLKEKIQAVIAKSPAPNAEEYAIHDYDGFPRTAEFGEWPDLQLLCDYVEAVSDHGSDVMNAAIAVSDNFKETLDAVENRYYGCFDRDGDYAESVADDSGWPDLAKRYFDFARYEHDMICGGDIKVVVIDGKNYVFGSE